MYVRIIGVCTCSDVSLPEVSRDDLPQRVQDFLRADDEELESQEMKQCEDQVLLSFPLDLSM